MNRTRGKGLLEGVRDLKGGGKTLTAHKKKIKSRQQKRKQGHRPRGQTTEGGSTSTNGKDDIIKEHY